MSRAKQEQVVLLKALEGLGASKDLMDLVKVVKEEEVGEETPLVIFLKSSKNSLVATKEVLGGANSRLK